MATLTPPPTPTEPPIARPPARFNWRWPLLLSLLITVILYLPAFFRADHDFAVGNLLTWITDGPVQPVKSDLVAWQTAGQLIRSRQLPLWDTTSNQPLLEATAAPVLYPGSLLIYFGGSWGPLLFILLHVWGLTFVLLCWLWNGQYFEVKPGPRGANVPFYIGLIVMCGILPFNIPAFLWMVVAISLAYWPRRTLAWIALPLPLGLLTLSIFVHIELTIILIAYSAVGFFWLYAGKPKGRQILQRIGLLILCSLAGLGLAGPQLFPRLTYHGPNFTTNSASTSNPPQLSAGQLEQWQIKPGGELEVRFSLSVQVNNLEIVLPGANGAYYPENWRGQLYTVNEKGEPGRKAGPAVALSQTDRLRANLTFDKDNPGAGRWLLQVRYQPFAFMLGLYAAFLVLLSQVMLVIVAGWVRFYREDENDHPLRRVVKNSATPMFAQLSGKVIDFTFALFLLRLLGPDGNGQWTFATTTWLFFATLCDFGLESLVTREVARVRSQPDAAAQVNRLFVTKLILRLIFSVAALPISLAWLGLVGLGGHLTAASFWAVVLLMIGFWPTAVVGSITVVFRGYEKFEYLAASQLLISVLRVPLGMAVLLAGWGPVGLAAVSILNNFVQLAILQNLLSRQGFRPSLRWSDFDWPFARQMLGQAFPLMLNGLIINVLFKSDGFALEALRGNTELGLYNSAYKFVDALLIIPSTLTFALFPLFSAYSENARENLLRAYHEGLRVLVIVALPIAAGTLFVAPDLIGFLGGSEFLPGGAIALQILIWFLPFSYINGITQYVLIAVDQQKKITRAVIVAALANVLLNLLLIPIAGYMASAALTILTELILLVPFTRITRDALGPGAVPLWRLSWRPLAAALLMMAALGGLWLLGINQFILSVVVGAVVYLAGLALTRAVTRQDLALLKKIARR